MRNFITSTLATLVALTIFSIGSIIISIGFVGALAGLSQTKPVVPTSAILTVDLSKTILAEQTRQTDLLKMLEGNTQMTTIGIYDAINAINIAASDPSISCIYMKPDMVIGGMAQIEELRTALVNFRMSGKAVVSYIENPTNGGFYLATASDKIYMADYDGCTNMFNGASSQMVFLKELLDNLGINVQLIRHGKYKSAGEMFINTSPSKENLEQNKAMIESIWQTWSGTIADARELRSEDLNQMIDNLVLNTPEDFLTNGLVDGLVTRDEMLTKLGYLSGRPGDLSHISLSDYALARKPLQDDSTKPKIAVVYLEGEMVDGNGLEQAAGDRFAGILSEIRKDENVKAVVLRVNSPGGSVLAAEKILAEIKLIQQGLPVIASFGDYAASGGYWISAGCDKIFSNATTLTGSIGVFSMIPDLSKTLDNKLHVNIVSVNSNKHSDMYSMMRPLDSPERQFMQKSVENIYDRFTTIVSEGRGLSKHAVDAIGQGRVWTGREAVGIGLADEIGTLEDAIESAISATDYGMEEVVIASYPEPLNTWETLMVQLEGTDNNILAGTPFKNVGEAFAGWTSAQAGKAYARMPYEFIIK